MERVDCIHDLLRRGRSKGTSVLLRMQGGIHFIVGNPRRSPEAVNEEQGIGWLVD
jgi:hypothetical protein